jgi:ABC-type sugar transport system ATPase subunit
MNLVPAGPVIAGFRPEALLPPSMVQGASLPLRVKVTHVEYLGAERVVYGVVPEGRFEGRKVVSRLPAQHTDGYAVDRVYDFAVPERELKLFDAGSEKRAPGGRVPEWR